MLSRVLSKWTKKRLRIALVVLDAVRGKFPKTQEFIDSTLKEVCEKEWMTPDGVVFASKLTKKVSLDKHFCFRFGTKGIIFCL